MSKSSRPTKEIYGDADGGFHNLETFRAELGADVAGVSDAEAMRMIDESLREKSKLTREQRAIHDDAADPLAYNDTVYKDMADNMRIKAEREEREKRRLAADLDAERANRSAAQNAQSRLRDELELEKMKRLYGDRFVWRSPGSLDDYLTKERLKREVKEELLDEKRKALQQQKLNKLWTGETSRAPTRKSKPKARSKSKSPKQKSRSKSPKRKSKK